MSQTDPPHTFAALDWNEFLEDQQRWWRQWLEAGHLWMSWWYSTLPPVQWPPTGVVLPPADPHSEATHVHPVTRPEAVPRSQPAKPLKPATPRKPRPASLRHH